jgi:hypothetical protein
VKNRAGQATAGKFPEISNIVAIFKPEPPFRRGQP